MSAISRPLTTQECLETIEKEIHDDPSGVFVFNGLVFPKGLTRKQAIGIALVVEATIDFCCGRLTEGKKLTDLANKYMRDDIVDCKDF